MVQEHGEPAHPFLRVMRDPEALQRGCELEAKRKGACLERPGQRRTEIVVGCCREIEPLAGAAARGGEVGACGQLEEVPEMAAAEVVGSRRSQELLECVLANRLQIVETVVARSLQQALLD